MHRHKQAFHLVGFGFLVVLTGTAIAQDRSHCDAVDARTAATARDDNHAFDFELGAWRAHTWRRVKPLAGSRSWDQYDGIEVVRRVGSGAANRLEFHADGPAGHLEGLSWQYYDALTQRWTLCYSNTAGGDVLIAAMGTFNGGRGEFYDQETYDEKAIVVRNVWSRTTPDARYFERSFSEDGGRTWEVNWITTYTRLRDTDESVR